MKKNVILINTSRGEIVSENDLVNFLRKNKNAKYFTDVINDEINNKWKSLIFKEFLKKCCDYTPYRRYDFRGATNSI